MCQDERGEACSGFFPVAAGFKIAYENVYQRDLLGRVKSRFFPLDWQEGVRK
jgi:hypothetical protein